MLRTPISVPRITLGIALVSLGIIFFATKPDNVIDSGNSFENEPVRIDMEVLEPNDIDKIPQRIIIPSLSTDLAVQRSDAVNGYWKVYSDRAGWGIGSGLPGEKGNQVIFAHAREGLFKPLRSIKVGENIYILNKKGWYAYKVEEIKEVYPRQTEVIKQTNDEILTLYTCTGYSDDKRLIIIARPVQL